MYLFFDWYIYIYIYIHTRSWGVSTLAKELVVATCIMQSSSSELSISVSNCAKCKQTKFNTYAVNSQVDVESQSGLGVCHWPDVMLGRFRSQLETSYMSSHTEELWYNKTICLSMTIYIYIYLLQSFSAIVFSNNTQQYPFWLNNVPLEMITSCYFWFRKKMLGMYLFMGGFICYFSI